MESDKPDKIARFLLWWSKNWHSVASLLAGAAGSVAGWIVDSAAWPIFLVAILLTLAAGYRALTLKPTYTQLLDEQAKNEDQLADHQAALKGILEISLRGLCDELGLWNPESRVSCYTHNGKAFVMVARISDNPSLAVPGRALYPEDQGVIGAAWREGKKAQIDLPVDNEKVYRKKLLRDYKMDDEVVAGLTMRSRSLLAIRVTDVRSTPEKHVGVLVLESLKPRGVTGTLYKSLTTSTSWLALQTFLCTSVDMLPDMVDAKEEGF